MSEWRDVGPAVFTPSTDSVVTEAVIVARDLADVASAIGMIGLKYGWAERYLGEAFEDLRDEPQAIIDALFYLHEAQRETAALIAELEGLK